MTLIFALECQILFLMVDYVGAHLKSTSYGQLFVRYCHITAFVL